MNNGMNVTTIVAGDIKLTSFIKDKKLNSGFHVINRIKKQSAFSEQLSYFSDFKCAKPEINVLIDLINDCDIAILSDEITFNKSQLHEFVYNVLSRLMKISFVETETSFYGLDLSQYLFEFDEMLYSIFKMMENSKVDKYKLYIISDEDLHSDDNYYHMMIQFDNSRECGLIFVELQSE